MHRKTCNCRDPTERTAIQQLPLKPSNLPLTVTNTGAKEGKTDQKNSPHLGRKEKSSFEPYPVRAVEGVRVGILFF